MKRLSARIAHYFFSPRFHFSRFQFNLISTILIGIGLIVGSYLTATKVIPKIFAANDTTKTWTINNTTASQYTAIGGVSFSASGATMVNQFANQGFESGTAGWSAYSQNASVEAGTGSDGAITISTTKTIDTTAIATGRTAADAVNFTLTTSVSAGATSVVISGDQSNVGLAANDELLFINLQGTSGDNGNVGKYETVRISSLSFNAVQNQTTINFSTSLINAYDGTTQKIMMQRVPNYTNVTIQNGGTLTTSTWNGTKGGVLFFRASATVDVQSGGSINATGKGYRGPASNSQGESYLGTGSSSSSANGGGGGATNSIQGGGAGYGSVGTVSLGGGGAGGNTYGLAALSKLLLGSAGGASAVAGGNGGGIIFVSANTVTVTGSIANNGSNGTGVCNRNGGGGSGGSTYLVSPYLTVGSSLVTATGGLGGQTCGPGGNGGTGRIRLDFISSTGTSSPASYAIASYAQTSSIAYSGTYSLKVIANSTDTAYITQSLNIGDTNTYPLTAYVYDGTVGNIGGTVSSSIAQLYYNGSAVATTYTNVGSGWWRLDGSVVGANASRVIGLIISAGKTVYVDSVLFPSRTIFTPVTVHSDLLVSSWDTFCEGTFSGGVCTATATKPAGTGIYYQICVDDIANCNSGNTWQYWSGSAWANATNLVTHRNTSSELTPSVMSALPTTNHKITVKVIFETTSENVPLLPSLSISYTTDTTPPGTNASNIAMKRSYGGTTVNPGAWTRLTSPYFSWTAGADTDGGSGVKGYCVYLGLDSDEDGQPDGDAATSKGLLGTSPGSTIGTTCQFLTTTNSIDFATASLKGNPWLVTSDKPYILSIKAVDNSGNIFAGSPATFTFKYDDTQPINVSFLSCASGSFSNVVDMSFNWPTSSSPAATDPNSGLLGWQYQINSTTGTWLGTTTENTVGVNAYIPLSQSGRTLTLAQDGASIVTGTNVIYLRAVDIAGNTSSDATIRTCNLSYGGEAPSFEGTDTVTVNPPTAITNSFAFSWPTAMPAHGKTITHYYYMINTPPPSTLSTLQSNGATYIDNGTWTTVSASALPGVNKGTNTVYVTAIDDASTPNYSPSNYISGTFTLNSTDPDNVGNLVASDSSIKASSQWNVTLSWTAPTYQGAGNLTYLIYRSSDGVTFVQTGTTGGLSYVDNVPSSKLYYYKVYTKDGANARSSGTNSVSIIPTGKWTTAPALDSGPTVGNITTKKATIAWGTSRSADSKILFGTESKKYGDVEPSNSTQISSHSIQLTGLTAGTTYYFKAKWTDEDGNTGESEEKSFTTAPAPSIKDVSAKNVGLTSGIVQFTSNNSTKVRIYYGASTSFGGTKEIATSTDETTYTAELSGLLDGTKYYYKINTFDSDGSEYDGTVLDFTTLPRPKISNVRLEQVANTAQTTIRVSWTTNTEISSIVTYYPEDNVGAVRDDVKVGLEKGAHSMIVRNLLPQSTYILVVKGRDRIGNEAVSDSQRFTTATDTRPPSVLNLKILGGTVPPVGFAAGEIKAQLVITWDTDELASSQVEFGQGTGATYAQKSQEDNNLTTNHTVILSNLTPSQVYHIRAVSRDSAGNVSMSIDTVTIAPKATKSALDLVVKNLSEAFSFVGTIKTSQ